MEITLTIVEAVELKVVQLIGKQDPYVTIKYDTFAAKTKVIDDGDRNCRWDESFTFTIHDGDIISFTVSDSNAFLDSKIGVTQLETQTLFQLNGHYEQWLDIKEEIGDNTNCGKLKIKVNSALPMIDHTPIPEILDQLTDDDTEKNRSGMENLSNLLISHETLELLFPTMFLDYLKDLVVKGVLVLEIANYLWRLSTVISSNDSFPFGKLFPLFVSILKVDTTDVFVNSLKAFSNFIIFPQFQSDPSLTVILDDLFGYYESKTGFKEQEAILKVLLQYSCKEISFFKPSARYQPLLRMLEDGIPEVSDICFAIFTNIIVENTICEQVSSRLVRIILGKWDNKDNIYILNLLKCLHNLVFNTRSHSELTTDAVIRNLLRLMTVSNYTKIFIIAIFYKMSSFDVFHQYICTDDVIREMFNSVNLSNPAKYMIVGYFRNLSCRTSNKEILKRSQVHTRVGRLDINNKDPSDYRDNLVEIAQNLK